MSIREQLESLRASIESASGAGGVGPLRAAVGQALGLSEPKGEPGAIRESAASYTQAATQADQVRLAIQRIASAGLPASWVGMASEEAGQVITAASYELDHTVTVFQQAGCELEALADAIEAAKEKYTRGLELLRQAQSALTALPSDPASFEQPDAGGKLARLQQARSQALEGITLLCQAAAELEDAGHRATGRFDGFASEARIAASYPANAGVGAPSGDTAVGSWSGETSGPSSGGSSGGGAPGAGAPSGSGGAAAYLVNGWMSQGYHGGHDGVDLAAPMGSPIYAAGSGTVIASGPAGGYGQWVRIEHADGWVTEYGHMSSRHVAVGDTVSAGQHIADVGSEGQSSGPHLHFEAHSDDDGWGEDPVAYMQSRGGGLVP